MSKLGRRELGANTRGALIQASRELILERGIGAISVRDIATRASVNQAMVRYHFGDKVGLMKATLEEGFEDLLAHLPDDGNFEETVRAHIGWVRKNPWLVSLMMKSLYGEPEVRSCFETQHAPRLIGIYKNAIRKGQSAGRIRTDLEPAFMITSLISLIIFPILADPIIGKVLSQSPGASSEQSYVDEMMKLFRPTQDQ